jgi:hypothetical protein
VELADLIMPGLTAITVTVDHSHQDAVH